MIKLSILFLALLLAVQSISALNVFLLTNSTIIMKTLDDVKLQPITTTYNSATSAVLEPALKPLSAEVLETEKTPPKPFIKLGSKYYIIQLGEEMTWFEAVDTCLKYNADLASIESDEELNALSNYIVNNDMGDYSFWLSANDIAKEGEYYWGNTGKPVTYAKWDEGEPNNTDEEENCVHLRFRQGELSMNDVPCDIKINFICAQKLKTNEVASPSELFAKVGSKYYMVVTERTLNWFDAQQVCRSYHARLTDIESEQELEALSDYLYENGWIYKFWFSGNDLGKEGIFHGSATGKKMTYANRQKGQPDNHGGNEKCAQLVNLPFAMHDANCDTKQRFICEFI